MYFHAAHRYPQTHSMISFFKEHSLFFCHLSVSCLPAQILKCCAFMILYHYPVSNSMILSYLSIRISLPWGDWFVNSVIYFNISFFSHCLMESCTAQTIHIHLGIVIHMLSMIKKREWWYKEDTLSEHTPPHWNGKVPWLKLTKFSLLLCSSRIRIQIVRRHGIWLQDKKLRDPIFIHIQKVKNEMEVGWDYKP